MAEETTPDAPGEHPLSDAGLRRHKTVCPLCDSEFHRFGVLKSARREVRFDSDLHVWYDGPNPDYYIVIVCPHCWFAAFAKDFATLPPWEKTDLAAGNGLAAMMVQIWQAYDFSQPRTAALAQRSLILALHWYRWRGDKYLNREAEVWLRLAWLEREAGPGHEQAERDYLERALRVLIRYYQQSELATATLERRVPYLIVELAVRLGKGDELRGWNQLWLALQDLARRYPADTLLQERWQDLQRIRRERGG